MSPHSGNNPSQMCAALIMFPIRQACLFGECVGDTDDLDMDSFFWPELFNDRCAGMFLQQIQVSLHVIHNLFKVLGPGVLSSRPASRSQINGSAESCDHGGEPLLPPLSGFHSHRKSVERRLCVSHMKPIRPLSKKRENRGEARGSMAGNTLFKNINNNAQRVRQRLDSTSHHTPGMRIL